MLFPGFGSVTGHNVERREKRFFQETKYSTVSFPFIRFQTNSNTAIKLHFFKTWLNNVAVAFLEYYEMLFLEHY